MTTKIHAVVDGRGLPRRFGLTPGQAHDTALVDDLLGGLDGACVVLADKGFDAERVRRLIEDQDAAPNIPDRRNRRYRHGFSRALGSPSPLRRAARRAGAVRPFVDAGDGRRTLGDKAGMATALAHGGDAARDADQWARAADLYYRAGRTAALIGRADRAESWLQASVRAADTGDVPRLAADARERLAAIGGRE